MLPGQLRSRWTLLLVAAAVAGVALRVAVWSSALGQPDGDEAVWGLWRSTRSTGT